MDSAFLSSETSQEFSLQANISIYESGPFVNYSVATTALYSVKETPSLEWRHYYTNTTSICISLLLAVSSHFSPHPFSFSFSLLCLSLISPSISSPSPPLFHHCCSLSAQTLHTHTLGLVLRSANLFIGEKAPQWINASSTFNLTSTAKNNAC